VLGWDLMHNGECRALMFAAGARSTLFISILFLSTALLQYANEGAGCTSAKGNEIAWNETMGRLQTEEEADLANVGCKGKVLGGLRPTSLLSSMASVANVIIAVVLPSVGAIIDYSDIRKKVVVYSFFYFWLGNFVQIFTSSSTWQISVVVQACVCSVSYMVHQTSILSYLSEVVDDDDGLKQINMAVRVWELGIMLAFMIAVAAVGMVMGPDNLPVKSQATLSQAAACVCSVPFFMVTMRQLGERKAKHKLPEGSSLLFGGITKFKKTFRYLSSSYPQASRMLIAAMFFEAANSNVVNSSVVLISQVLEIENPSTILLMIMVICVPGAMAAPSIQRRLGNKMAMVGILLINILASVLVVTVVNDPEAADYIYIVGFLYGVGLGATYPIQRTLFLSLAPCGQEAEMFGIWQSCCLSIQWLPGVIFTYINEVTGSVVSAIVVVPVFHLLGLICVLAINLEEGVAAANETSHLKHLGIEERAAGPGGATTKVTPEA